MSNSTSTIRQGVKANTDAKVLKAKLALNWTRPYKALAVGRCSAAETPAGLPLGRNLLYLDFPSDLPGSDACWRVAIERDKVPTPTTAGTYRRGCRSTCSTNLPRIPAVPRHSRRRFDSPTSAGGGADHW